jgi:siroheme synthase (precorrin-2 oxidase/ferrochelatase)
MRVLLIGDGDIADETAEALAAAGAEVARLGRPSDDDVRELLGDGDGFTTVAVVSRDDAFVLRVALMVRYVDEDVPLLVTIFDETMAGHVRREIPHCDVTSLADIVAPSLAGPCLGEDLVAVDPDHDPPLGLTEDGERADRRPLEVPSRRRVRALLTALLRPYDRSAGLLLFGAIGVIAVLVIETLGAVAVLGQGPVDALYGAGKTVVTVDPNPEVERGPKWFKTFITASMLVALVCEASFTAGLVNRLIDRRLTGIVGRRAVPRRDHVVVVGVGQVGLRLCMLLRRCGMGVVAVDDREEGENVGMARELGLPVVVGRGADVSLLRRLSLGHACALAAVTADDLENISIAMAARAIAPDLRVVLRAGDGRLANETRSLFRIGVVRDVHRIAAALLAAHATGSDARSVVCRGNEAYLLHDDGSLEPAPMQAAA